MSRGFKLSVVAGPWRGLTLLLLLAACGSGPVNEPERSYVPGTSYFGSNRYIEYIAGDLPLIFSVPHGGTLLPAEIPDRTPGTCGGAATVSADGNTAELARAIEAVFVARTGKHPHIVINRLDRRKLDANRDLTEAACGNAEAQIAWREYQDFIAVAKARVRADFGKGWFTDVHGQRHSIRRIEVGYQLTAAELRLPDAVLDSSRRYETLSSIRTFSEQSPLSFAALLRGATSLGTLLAGAGYPATPSSQDPAPAAGQEYFSGGHNTAVHGCSAGGSICSVQLEHPFEGVRDTAAHRGRYAAELVRIYEAYLSQFGIKW
jgi:hypothetical protein